MATDRRRQLLLGALIVVLAVVLYRAWKPTFTAPAAAPNGRTAAPSSARGTVAPASAPDVHLRALDQTRAKPEPADRNLFRFRPKAPPPAPARVVPPPVTAPGPSVPAGPPPPPPIQLKFIGVIEGTDHNKIAVLSDGRTPVPFHGHEGDIIEGRYRILKIGEESIELAYLDGRGRQTIRLSGS